MKLSRTLAYAIQAMVLLSDQRGKGSLTCHQMAKAAGMPERFLLQLLRSLVKTGLLRSSRGVHGGYWLDRCPEDITLLEIFEAVDGELDFKASNSAVRSTRLEAALSDVRDRIRSELTAIKLSSVLEERSEQPTGKSPARDRSAVLTNGAPVDETGVVERTLLAS